MTPGTARAILSCIPHGDVWALAGGHAKQARKDLMALLCGHKVPTSQCGVGALRAKLEAILSPAAGCPARRNDEMFAKLREIAGVAS